MREALEKPLKKTLISPEYGLILMGSFVGGYEIFQILLDIKEQGIDWLDMGLGNFWVWYFLVPIFVGHNSLLRKAHNIVSGWQPPHLLRVISLGGALGWALHMIIWLIFNR